MRSQFDAMQALLQRFPQAKSEGHALSNMFADIFWLLNSQDGSGDDVLSDMALFRGKVSEALAFAESCYNEHNVEGFTFCISALSRVRHLLTTPGLMEEQCWLLRAALGQVSVVYGLLLADQEDWEGGERCFTFARETAEKMDAAHRIDGVPTVVRGGLRWRTLLCACELRCRAWLLGEQLSGRAVYSPYEALGLLRTMPSGRSFIGTVQLAALQVTKFCLVAAKDVFQDAVTELSNRCELDFSSKPGAWRLYDSNSLLDRQHRGRLDSYIFIELELYKELESGRCTEDTMERLWSLRDRSLELFYPQGYELETLRAVLEKQRHAMLARCIDSGRLRDAR